MNCNSKSTGGRSEHAARPNMLITAMQTANIPTVSFFFISLLLLIYFLQGITFGKQKSVPSTEDTPCIVSPIVVTQFPIHWELEIRNAYSYPSVLIMKLCDTYSVSQAGGFSKYGAGICHKKIRASPIKGTPAKL